MNTFLTGENLGNTIYNIIWEAEKTLLIVSPFIKLDNYFKKLFDKHQNNPKIHITIVFGKNEDAVKNSMSKEDFDYFKKFLNISIVHVPNLHAKYYGNEKEGIITSINLYDYSFKNNIEFGVYNKQGMFSGSTDRDAWNTCVNIAKSNEVVFIKRPVYQTTKLIIEINKRYIKSDVLHDGTNRFYRKQLFKKNTKEPIKTLKDFSKDIELGAKPTNRPSREETTKPSGGFCIRSGKKIKFNPKQPMHIDAWRIWREYENENYPEKYCHKTGKPSHGKTSMKNPIL